MNNFEEGGLFSDRTLRSLIPIFKRWDSTDLDISVFLNDGEDCQVIYHCLNGDPVGWKKFKVEP